MDIRPQRGSAESTETSQAASGRVQGVPAPGASNVVARQAVPDAASNGTNGATHRSNGNGQNSAPLVRTATISVTTPDDPELFSTKRLHPRGPVLNFRQNTEVADQYRLIRTRIMRHPLAPRVVLITSPGQGDGKTLNSINIAATLSMAKDSDVLLIGGDANGDLSIQLGLDADAPGLTNVLTGETPIQKATITTVQFPNLFILPCGTEPREMPELLNSAAWPAVMRYARASFRYVIIDAPPCGLVADYFLLESAADGVALVIRPDHTNRRMLRSALEEIPRQKFLGVLTNCYRDYIFWRRLDYYGRQWD